MDSALLIEKFEKMGARAKLAPELPADRVRIDIRRDARGEYFEVACRPGVTVDALDVRRRDRHLLLAARDTDAVGLPVGAGQRFLCGHDERAWFVAAVPEGRPASNVAQAMDALKPWAVQAALGRFGVRHADRNRRRTAAFVRQGEWFFVPGPRWFAPPRPELVRRDEPLVRTGGRPGGKPHVAEFAYRENGELVYLNAQTQQAVSEPQYRRLVREKPGRAANFVQQRRNMTVMVRGRVRHPDHATIVLDGWHQVFMNTENRSQAMQYVAFVD